MERSRCRSPSTQTARFTERQGQYLACIHAYTKVNGRPPAQADMQRYFAVTAPSVHQMVLSLERRGLRGRPEASRCSWRRKRFPSCADRANSIDQNLCAEVLGFSTARISGVARTSFPPLDDAREVLAQRLAGLVQGARTDACATWHGSALQSLSVGAASVAGGCSPSAFISLILQPLFVQAFSVGVFLEYLSCSVSFCSPVRVVRDEILCTLPPPSIVDLADVPRPHCFGSELHLIRIQFSFIPQSFDVPVEPIFIDLGVLGQRHLPRCSQRHSGDHAQQCCRTCCGRLHCQRHVSPVRSPYPCSCCQGYDSDRDPCGCPRRHPPYLLLVSHSGCGYRSNRFARRSRSLHPGSGLSTVGAACTLMSHSMHAAVNFGSISGSMT